MWPPFWNTRDKNTEKYPGAGYLFLQWPYMLFQSGGDKSKLFYTFNKYISYITDKLVTRKVIAFSQKIQAETASTRWNMKWLWKFKNSAYDEIYFIDDNIHNRTLIIYKGFWSNFQTLVN